MNTNIVSACSNRSLNPFSYRKSCSHAVYLKPYYLAGCGEWIWYTELILHWRLNLFKFVQSVGWKVKKY